MEWLIENKNNNHYYNRVPGAAGGGLRIKFEQSASTHSGVGENETLNINVVGTNADQHIQLRQLRFGQYEKMTI